VRGTGMRAGFARYQVERRDLDIAAADGFPDVNGAGVCDAERRDPADVGLQQLRIALRLAVAERLGPHPERSGPVAREEQAAAVRRPAERVVLTGMRDGGDLAAALDCGNH